MDSKKKSKKKNENVVFVLLKQNKKDGVMPDRRYSLNKSFSAEDYIYHNGEERRIAYVQGESSCFPEDWRQKDPKMGDAPSFDNRGLCTCKPSEKGKIMFMRLNNRNVSNTDKLDGEANLYKELDNTGVVSSIMEERGVHLEAQNRAWELTKDEDKARAFARQKGLYGQDGAYQMRILKFADDSPKAFLDFVNNAQDMESAIRLDMIHRANEEGYIIFNQGRWFWKNSDVSIIAVAKSVDAHEYLTGWTFSGSEGKIFWNNLHATITKTEDKTSKDTISLTRDELKFLKGVEPKEIFDTCKEAKIITFSQEFKQYQFDNGAEEFNIGFSKNKAYEWIASNEDGVDDLRSRFVMAKKTEDKK